MASFERMVRKQRESKPFAGFRIFGVQHLLPDMGGLIRAFAGSGAGVENVQFMGKTYSQHHRAMEELRQAGHRIFDAQFESELDVRFGPFGAEASAKNNRPAELLNYIESVTGYRPGVRSQKLTAKKFVVIDDGGGLIELIHKHYPELHGHIVAVEQTRKGTRRISKFKHELKFPVINVAECFAKLRYESPLIGRDLANATAERLTRLEGQGIKPGKKILLMGYGAVGEAAARALRKKGYAVEVYDKSKKARLQASRGGFAVHQVLAPALAESRVVLSVTGECTLDKKALERLPDGAIVMNGASGATELFPDLKDILYMHHSPSGTRWQGKFQGRPFDMGGTRANFGAPSGQDWVVYQQSGKELMLVNQGHPINFDGQRKGIPARFIQLTRGLLYLGAVQATRTTKAGLHDLSRAPQRRFLHSLWRELRASGESLLHPTF